MLVRRHTIGLVCRAFLAGALFTAGAAALPAFAADAPPPPATSGPNSVPEQGADKLDIGGLADAAAKADLAVAGQPSMKASARFEQVETGVKVLVDVEGAPPGKKGVHVHEKGDCSNIPGKSMGEHFAPKQEPHGLPDAPQHHVGDLGNMVVDQNGKGRLEILAKGANLEQQDPMSFLGRAIVIHEGEDKGTQPSGDSGTPMACGVIEEA
jgi:superoxide dismutase, Cu-Zn family